MRPFNAQDSKQSYIVDWSHQISRQPMRYSGSHIVDVLKPFQMSSTSLTTAHRQRLLAWPVSHMTLILLYFPKHSTTKHHSANASASKGYRTHRRDWPKITQCVDTIFVTDSVIFWVCSWTRLTSAGDPVGQNRYHTASAFIVCALHYPHKSVYDTSTLLYVIEHTI